MAKNITYLLGAGASANCLPVVNSLPQRLKFFKDDLEYASSDNTHINNRYISQELKGYTESLINDIGWLLNEMKAHKTVDTLAKRFYLTSKNHESLLKLKKILSTFFVYEQTIQTKFVNKEMPDKRYDSLIATIINDRIDDLDIPGNFKIITWNYDFQFELAYEFYQTGISSDMQAKIQSIPSTSFLSPSFKFDYQKFGLVRLNGIAGLSYFRNDFLSIVNSDSSFQKFQDSYNSIIRFYHEFFDEDVQTFNFSWEDPKAFPHIYERSSEAKKIANEIMRQTSILVVIGYSFPLFNRKVDRELIRSLPPHLEKIYIQDEKERVEDVRNLFIDSFDSDLWLDNNPDFFKSVSYTDQFFIPQEATL